MKRALVQRLRKLKLVDLLITMDFYLLEGTEIKMDCLRAAHSFIFIIKKWKQGTFSGSSTTKRSQMTTGERRWGQNSSKLSPAF